MHQNPAVLPMPALLIKQHSVRKLQTVCFADIKKSTEQAKAQNAIYIYYLGNHKMKVTARALFGVATHYRLVTGRDTRNRGMMLISGV